METLKRKIFDVLTGKITVSEFENWLYNCEEILENLDSNSFYFDVIEVNYKSNKWKQLLTNIFKEYISEEQIEVFRIENICEKIISSKTFDETHLILKEEFNGFNFDTNFSILWKLYFLYDIFDLVKEGFEQEGELEAEAKFYAEETLNIFEKSDDFEILKIMLEQELPSFKPIKIESKKVIKPIIKPKKITLKQKILAFFKKS
ncbi:hypothetical protein [Mesoflavibacter sp. CH_XMU1404-2]|uniref:hypothetical protein n=1 Tax=Mesoflavibacter sp. CH_XMU1404-2 TaxID=3107766 RepID=UPI00243D7D91